MTILLDLTLACLLGAMIFFPSVVAPTVFKVLPGDHAGRFLRRLFVGYYGYLMITAGLSAILLYRDPLAAAGMAAIALTTAYVLFSFMPRLNRWRDAELAGDGAAGKKFAYGHRATVILNAVQLLGVIAVIILRGLGNVA